MTTKQYLNEAEMADMVKRAESGESVTLMVSRWFPVTKFPDMTDAELGQIEQAIYDAMEYGEAVA